ncbi:MAG TPA: recombination regulator RecX [Burkholderiales bacterium]|nr:recombination regulator RecX [Burkholderiales bacterium]
MEEKPDTPAELKARALRYLVRREHSRAELARKLAPHAESPQAVEALLDSLLSRKQLSDERFAEERARSLSRKYGAAKIRQDLKARGISDEVIGRVATGDELERARAIFQRKFPVESRDRAEQAKRARFLQSRGFSYDIISRVLKNLE